MRQRILAVLASAAVAALPSLAAAALNPVVTGTAGAPVGGSPGIGRVIHGYITMGAADTYVTGGFTITPQQIGLNNAITAMYFSAPNGAYEAVATYSVGVATVRFVAPATGASNVTATATTKVVTPGFTLSPNTPILCQLNDGATGGGGTGTWPVTDAISTCDYTSATTFTMTVIAAAPTGGGNFVWVLPNVSSEIPAATSVASVVIPYVATGN